MSPPTADPYGVDLAMTAAGDLAVAGSGSLATVGEAGVLAQALWLRTKSTPGELPLHEDFGVSDPTGQKMNPAGIAALLGSQLIRVPEHDGRFASVTITGATSPVEGDPTALALDVSVVAAGGTAFTVSGLPEQAHISEVVNPTGVEGGLSLLAEEQAYGGEEAEETEPAPGSPQAVAQALGELESEL